MDKYILRFSDTYKNKKNTYFIRIKIKLDSFILFRYIKYKWKSQIYKMITASTITVYNTIYIYTNYNLRVLTNMAVQYTTTK